VNNKRFYRTFILFKKISIKTPFGTPIFEKFGQGFPVPRLSSQEYKYIGIYFKFNQ
jgi:hypothetical protein